MGNHPYRILQIVTSMDRGGIETMLMNYLRALDRQKVQFDFIVHRQARGAYDDEIEALGGRIFRAPKIRPWSYPIYFKWLDKFFREHKGEFQAVHGHLQENSGFALKYARKYDINRRLASSHIAMPKDYKYLFRQYALHYVRQNVTDRIACGQDAGRHMFGNMPFIIMRNAINTDRFLYNQSLRNAIRDELGISKEATVIGHVGRFNYQKNHKFLIDIFETYLKKDEKAHLLLVGDGNLRNEIVDYVNEKGISTKVSFLGSRNDVSNILQACDVFLMPSLFEGLPVSAIEAQASGLPCVMSDTIDPTTDITDNVEFLSLKQDPLQWSETILKLRGTNRNSTKEKIIEAGYDVESNLITLLNLYGII